MSKMKVETENTYHLERQMNDHAAIPFTGAAKVETFIKDFNRLRDLIRTSADPELEKAWDRCERWVFCMTPNPKD